MNFHILTQRLNQKTINCVFHIPIPTGNNDAEISWRDAIVMEQGGADNIESILTDITPEEIADMKAGNIFELQTNIRFSSLNLNNAQRLQEIQTAYSQANTKLIAEKLITLNFMGYKGDVS